MMMEWLCVSDCHLLTQAIIYSELDRNMDTRKLRPFNGFKDTVVLRIVIEPKLREFATGHA